MKKKKLLKIALLTIILIDEIKGATRKNRTPVVTIKTDPKMISKILDEKLEQLKSVNKPLYTPDGQKANQTKNTH